MKTLHKEIHKTLNWVQVGSSKRDFELQGESDIFGRLKWHQHFGSLAVAATADGEWTFHKTGFLHSRVSVELPGSNKEVAIIRNNRAGTGVVEFATGLNFFWINKNGLRSIWSFTHLNGEEILSLQSLTTPVRLQIQVDLLKDLSVSPLLTCLGLYLLVLMHVETVTERTLMVPVVTSP